MKVVFMGTPEFARDVLKAVYEAGHEVTAVYTQPDKPKGRSGALIASPVKEYAVEMGLPVYQPEKIKIKEEVETLSKIPADIFIVAAYGQFLSEDILNMPKYGCVNVHGSLLPKLRGAAPIQRSIALGLPETGVTIMRMDKGMDSGDMIAKAIVPINPTDDEVSMYDKLAKEGAKLLVEVLPAIEDGSCVYVKQNPEEATFAPMLKKEDGLADFNKTAWELDCMVRGFSVWPNVYTYHNGKLLKIYKAKALDKEDVKNIEAKEAGLQPGEVLVTKKNLYVAAADGLLELLEVQPEGKKRMPAMDFARGTHLQTKDSIK